VAYRVIFRGYPVIVDTLQELLALQDYLAKESSVLTKGSSVRSPGEKRRYVRHNVEAQLPSSGDERLQSLRQFWELLKGKEKQLKVLQLLRDSKPLSLAELAHSMGLGIPALCGVLSGITKNEGKAQLDPGSILRIFKQRVVAGPCLSLISVGA
jgi:hypothetical protein